MGHGTAEIKTRSSDSWIVTAPVKPGSSFLTIRHLLLQIRVKTLNGELSAVFKCWYPDLQIEEELQAA